LKPLYLPFLVLGISKIGSLELFAGLALNPDPPISVS
jgi:hypothetical protein